jgi:TonB family protein
MKVISVHIEFVEFVGVGQKVKYLFFKYIFFEPWRALIMTKCNESVGCFLIIVAMLVGLAGCKSKYVDEFIPIDKNPTVDMQQLMKLVEYPSVAMKDGIEGIVVVRAMVDTNGKISNIVVDKSDNKVFDKAAIKAVNALGNATPAMYNNKPVKCWLSIPIHFKLP